MKPANAFDMEIAARTVFAEFSGEGPDAVKAGAWCIANRWRAGKWYSGDTLAECCLMAFQFSSWNTTDPNRKRLAIVDTNDQVLNACRSAVLAAVLQRGTDPVEGATHYEAMPPDKLPDWTKGARMTGQIGKTRFYKGVA